MSESCKSSIFHKSSKSCTNAHSTDPLSHAYTTAQVVVYALFILQFCIFHRWIMVCKLCIFYSLSKLCIFCKSYKSCIFHRSCMSWIFPSKLWIFCRSWKSFKLHISSKSSSFPRSYKICNTYSTANQGMHVPLLLLLNIFFNPCDMWQNSIQLAEKIWCRCLWWKTIIDGTQSSTDDNLWWKTNLSQPLKDNSFDGKWHLMKDNLWWRTTFDGRLP